MFYIYKISNTNYKLVILAIFDSSSVKFFASLKTIYGKKEWNE